MTKTLSEKKNLKRGKTIHSTKNGGDGSPQGRGGGGPKVREESIPHRGGKRTDRGTARGFVIDGKSNKWKEEGMGQK